MSSNVCYGRLSSSIQPTLTMIESSSIVQFHTYPVCCQLVWPQMSLMVFKGLLFSLLRQRSWILPGRDSIGSINSTWIHNRLGLHKSSAQFEVSIEAKKLIDSSHYESYCCYTVISTNLLILCLQSYTKSVHYVPRRLSLSPAKERSMSPGPSSRRPTSTTPSSSPNRWRSTVTWQPPIPLELESLIFYKLQSTSTWWTDYLSRT